MSSKKSLIVARFKTKQLNATSSAHSGSPSSMDEDDFAHLPGSKGANIGNAYKRSTNFRSAVHKTAQEKLVFSVRSVAADSRGVTPELHNGGSTRWVVSKWSKHQDSRKLDSATCNVVGHLPSGCGSLVYTAYVFFVSPQKERAAFLSRCSEYTKRKLLNGELDKRFDGYYVIKSIADVETEFPTCAQFIKSFIEEVDFSVFSDCYKIDSLNKPEAWYKAQPWWPEYWSRSHYGVFSRLRTLIGTMLEHEDGSENHLSFFTHQFPWYASLEKVTTENPWMMGNLSYTLKIQIPRPFSELFVQEFAIAHSKLETSSATRKVLQARAIEKAKHTLLCKLYQVRAETGDTALRLDKRHNDPVAMRHLLGARAVSKARTSQPGKELYVLKDDSNNLFKLVNAIGDKQYNWVSSSKTSPYPDMRTLSFSSSSITQEGKICAPCVPSSELCPEQREVVEHVHRNWLTIVCGTPGSGKTECVTYLRMRYKNTLVLSKCNVMVAALNGRVGGGSRTVDSAAHSFANRGKGKNEAFDDRELLIIDECSNLSLRDMASALSLAQQACRIVLLGDENQIPSIEQGSPFHSLIEAYPKCVHRLQTNHRVEEHSKQLVKTYKAVLDGEIEEVMDGFHPFSSATPAHTLVHADYGQTESYHDVVPRILASETFAQTQDWQMLAMNRETVAQLNLMAFKHLYPSFYAQAERLYREKQPILVARGMRICFRSNKQATSADLALSSNGVNNGEIDIVQGVKDFTDAGLQIKVHQSCVPAKSPPGVMRVLFLCSGKRVVLDSKNGIPPSSVDYGWAATVDSMQGAEEKTVLFVHPADEMRGTNWTRSHLYVAVSRAKRRLWLAGRKNDYEDLLQCTQIERESDLVERIKASGFIAPFNLHPRDPTTLDYVSVDLYNLKATELKGEEEKTERKRKSTYSDAEIRECVLKELDTLREGTKSTTMWSRQKARVQENQTPAERGAKMFVTGRKSSAVMDAKRRLADHYLGREELQKNEVLKCIRVLKEIGLYFGRRSYSERLDMLEKVVEVEYRGTPPSDGSIPKFYAYYEDADPGRKDSVISMLEGDRPVVTPKKVLAVTLAKEVLLKHYSNESVLDDKSVIKHTRVLRDIGIKFGHASPEKRISMLNDISGYTYIENSYKKRTEDGTSSSSSSSTDYSTLSELGKRTAPTEAHDSDPSKSTKKAKHNPAPAPSRERSSATPYIGMQTVMRNKRTGGTRMNTVINVGRGVGQQIITGSGVLTNDFTGKGGFTQTFSSARTGKSTTSYVSSSSGDHVCVDFPDGGFVMMKKPTNKKNPEVAFLPGGDAIIVNKF